MTEKVESPQIHSKYIIKLQNKDFVTYFGLINLAHQIGLKSLEVQILQLPSTENNDTCICMATVTSSDGQVFSDIGDANPKNCNRMITPHLIRMASTRAKGRVLRDFCDIDMACWEELNPDEFQGEKSNGQQSQNNGIKEADYVMSVINKHKKRIIKDANPKDDKPAFHLRQVMDMCKSEITPQIANHIKKDEEKFINAYIHFLNTGETK